MKESGLNRMASSRRRRHTNSPIRPTPIASSAVRKWACFKTASQGQKSHARHRAEYRYRSRSAIRIRADGYGPNVMSNGCIPTLAIVAATVSDEILMTVTVVLLVSDTYSFVWSGVICDMKGPCPAGIVARAPSAQGRSNLASSALDYLSQMWISPNRL